MEENIINDINYNKVHWSFWVVAVIALIWNLLGCINFFAQMNAQIIASMPETHRAIIEGRPLWATAGFALAVFGGAMGCLLLLFRKSLASYLFIASLAGVFVQLIPHIHLIGSTINNPFEIIMMILMPVIVAVFLIWYSSLSKRKAWLN